MVGQTRQGRLLDGTRRDTRQINRIELIAAEKIWPHLAPFDGDRDFSQVDGALRDRASPKGEAKQKMRWRVNTLQRGPADGKFSGHPWTPRVGDLCVVLWYNNEKGIVIGTIPNKEQEPVCRPGSNTRTTYDQVWKITPWDEPSRNAELDFNKFPDPRNPDCLKWWDERPGGMGRDWIFCKNCKPGNDEPSCESCAGPDHILQGCSWFKLLSDRTLARRGKPDRVWHHHLSGSTMFFDKDGVVYVENRVSEEPKGHLKFFPDGKIEIQSASNPSGVVCGCSGDGSGIVSGARITLHRNGEIELNNLDVGGESTAFIRIAADGEITIKTPRKISIISEEEDVLIKAATKITLDAPLIDEVTGLVHNRGNQVIDGSCDHGSCSCPCGGSGECPIGE